MNLIRLVTPAVLAAALAFSGTAAAQTFQWAVSAGSTGLDRAQSVAADAAGNVYVAGSFTGTVDFDPGTGVATAAAPGYYSGFVAKYNSAGAFQWVRTYGNGPTMPYWSSALKVAVDAAGRVTVVGYFNGTTDFDPGPATVSRTSAQYGEAFAVRYDASGAYQWLMTPGAGSTASALAVDAAGNFYVGGNVYGSGADLDPGSGVATLDSLQGTLFVAKYSPSGAFVWARNMALSTGSLSMNNLMLGAGGDLYATGAFNGSLNFNTTAGQSTQLTANGYQDTYFLKLSPTGSLKWGRNIGATGATTTISTAAAVNLATGTLYLGTQYTGTIDVDPGPGTTAVTSAGSSNILLAAYDSTGAYQWHRNLSSTTVSGSGSNDASSMALDAGGNLFFSGYYTGSVDFDPGPGVDTLPSVGPNRTLYIAKYTGSGAHLWAKSLRAVHPKVFSVGALSANLALDAQGTLYAAGAFADTVDFSTTGNAGGTRVSQGDYDLWVAKWTGAGTAAATTGVPAATASSLSLVLTPNPVRSGQAVVQYGIPAAGPVAGTVTDLAGRQVYTWSDAGQPAGQHQIILPVLPPGSYLIQVKAGTAARAQQLIVLD